MTSCQKCHKECPSFWLIFSLILRVKYESNHVLKLKDCFNVTQECGISSLKELTIALSFIHSRLRLVQYFDDKELESLVVIDPEVLFNKITDLTSIGKNANQDEIEEFCQKGIISVAVMKRINERSNEGVQLPFTWISKLLNHLRLAALFKDCYMERKTFFRQNFAMFLKLMTPLPVLCHQHLKLVFVPEAWVLHWKMEDFG